MEMGKTAMEINCGCWERTKEQKLMAVEMQDGGRKAPGEASKA
jgi:hypothetical protein